MSVCHWGHELSQQPPIKGQRTCPPGYSNCDKGNCRSCYKHNALHNFPFIFSISFSSASGDNCSISFCCFTFLPAIWSPFLMFLTWYHGITLNTYFQGFKSKNEKKTTGSGTPALLFSYHPRYRYRKGVINRERYHIILYSLCFGKCSCLLHLQMVGRRWVTGGSQPQE